MLKLQEVSKKYGKVQALSDINLEFDSGIYGLLGPNGAGKTTLMRILATIISQDKGSIYYNKIKWTDRNKVRSIIGYLPQKFSLYKNLTVYEALLHIGALKGLENNIEKVVIEVIKKVNLEKEKDKKMKALSGGMLRRVGIAQAIIGNPEIIIVDEPTAGLDPEERIRFRNLIQRIGEERLVIISTHIVEDVQAICDKVTVLHSGNVVISGEIEDIIKSAHGNIWRVQLLEKEYWDFIKYANIISQNKISRGYEVKVLCENKPHQNAKLELPTLEDSYLCLIGERNEE